MLLTAITSLHCEVHESSLLLAVRACFHIHLISKVPANKTSAKAALTQMLSVVNQRMEQFEKRSLLVADSTTVEARYVRYIAGWSCLMTSSNGVKTRTSESALEQIPEEEGGGGAQDDGVADGLVDSTKTSASVVFASVYHKDSYLLFRALCKLSMKGLNDEQSSGAQNDAIALQNK